MDDHLLEIYFVRRNVRFRRWNDLWFIRQAADTSGQSKKSLFRKDDLRLGGWLRTGALQIGKVYRRVQEVFVQFYRHCLAATHLHL